MKGCDFCTDLRNVEPAKYLGGGDSKFKNWIEDARKNKKFILLHADRLEIIDKCPVCGHEFTDEDYDNYY